MTDSIQLTVVFETVEDGWVQAQIREIPAVITVAPTRQEAKGAVIDALREYLLSLEETPTDAGDGGDQEPLALTFTA